MRRIESIDRFLFRPPEKAQHSAQLWHTAFSVLNALQSALLLFLITRICGDDQAGIFSLSFSVAYLMIMIGNYGVRNYQATDVHLRFGFREYLIHRVAACVLMAVASVGYVLIRGYEPDKATAVLLCCLLKLTESVENVYHGEYQRVNRLDVASKIGTIRFILCMIVFALVLLVTHDMLASLVAINIAAAVVLAVSLAYTCPRIAVTRSPEAEDWKRIFIVCLPLFLASFFNIYICNASKYALDIYSTEAIQGYYGMLFMPVFVINLISNCIYGPFLVRLAGYWNEGTMKPLQRFVRNQILAILGICAAVTLFGWFPGIQLLSWFFGRDLTEFRLPFAILLIGGGMTALVDFMNNIMTVIRKQKVLVWIYGVCAVAALILTNILVKEGGISGAAWAYTVILLIQAIIMTAYVVIILRKRAKTE